MTTVLRRLSPRSRNPLLYCTLAALALSTQAFAAAPARALISPPVTLEHASADVVELGGAALAPDGSGGIVYTKLVGGVPHVFAVRYLGGRWGSPVRVDTDVPYDGTAPRIAAGDGGELLVVWVTQMATVHDHVQRGLVAARLSPGAASFSPLTVVDPNVGDGASVSPSLSRTAPNEAVVAYRVVTNDFSDPATAGTAVQLRPGDVMEDVRVAVLSDSTWLRLGAINHDASVSMRPPTDATAPQVEAGIAGNAVVAWQEPDERGVARVWLRRVFRTVPFPGAAPGTTPDMTLGSALEASPTTWNGAPVTDDADAFSLGTTDLAQARVAVRVDAAPGSALGASSLFLNTLPQRVANGSGILSGPLFVAADPSVGAPGVSIDDVGGLQGSMLLGWTAGGGVRLARVADDGSLVPLPAIGPRALAGAPVVTAVNPGGGGVAAWPAADASGNAGVGVAEDFPAGAAQAAVLSSDGGGPVSHLSIGSATSGDALVAFQQGQPGRVELVADRVTVPPASFPFDLTPDWVRPRAARITWDPAPSVVGGVTYSVLLDGRVVARRLTRRSLLPSARLLGDGARRVQVLATDALGQQVLSPARTLHVDARPPRVSVAGVGRRRRGRALPLRVVVSVRDPESGVARGTTRCSFGDRTHGVRGTGSCRHAYRRAGTYTIVVRARDVLGNRTTRKLPVAVR